MNYTKQTMLFPIHCGVLLFKQVVQISATSIFVLYTWHVFRSLKTNPPKKFKWYIFSAVPRWFFFLSVQVIRGNSIILLEALERIF